MLVAEFTSKIPNMGEVSIAHVKSRELLEALQTVTNNRVISSEVQNVKFL